MVMTGRSGYILKAQGFVGPMFECRCRFLVLNRRDKSVIKYGFLFFRAHIVSSDCNVQMVQ